LKILLDQLEIRAGVERLATSIAADYAGRPLTVIGVLTGSLMLLADLIRQLDLPLRVGVVQARSYRGVATTPGELELHLDLLPEIQGREVLLVDDIFDTGHTLATLMDQIQAREPRSLRSAVLLRKLGRQEVSYTPDYVAFEIPDEFVVGYGLDYQDAYRHLPYIATLEAADLAGPPP
jgi:hypoxanthine phosphoribosyltransferase